MPACHSPGSNFQMGGLKALNRTTILAADNLATYSLLNAGTNNSAIQARVSLIHKQLFS